MYLLAHLADCYSVITRYVYQYISPQVTDFSTAGLAAFIGLLCEVSVLIFLSSLIVNY